MVRELRIQKGHKQREVAEFIGCKLSTYGNVESSPFKVIGRARVEKLVKLYSLTPDRAAELRTMWENVPLSPYSLRQRAKWQKRNTLRSMVARVPVLELALVEILSFAAGFAPDDALCVCGFDGLVEGSDRACEVCEALSALRLPEFSGREKLVSDLGVMHDRLMALRAPEATPEAP